MVRVPLEPIPGVFEVDVTGDTTHPCGGGAALGEPVHTAVAELEGGTGTLEDVELDLDDGSADMPQYHPVCALPPRTYREAPCHVVDGRLCKAVPEYGVDRGKLFGGMDHIQLPMIV